MPTVTEKSTKSEIFDAYQAAVSQLKSKQEVQLNPEKVKASRRKTEVIEKVKALSIDSVSKGIDTVRNRTAGILAQLEQDLAGQLGELSTVQEALAARQQELKDIYGIEAEATGLAALVEAQRERRVAFDKELADRRVAFETEMTNARNAWNIEKAEYLRTSNLRNEQDRVARDRELETSKYNFERDQKAKYDKLADELTVRTKAFEADMELRNKKFNEMLEALTKREALQKELETKVATLETEKTSLLASIESKIAAATESAKKSAQVGFGIEVNAIKKSYEADVTVLKGKVDSLSAQVDEYRTANNMLTNKLEAAYAKVQSVAERALEAQGGRQALAAVQQAVETAGSSKR
jgi:hypothetical protein